ncbi:MAG: guanylate kinase [Planctomycetota bacterium]
MLSGPSGAGKTTVKNRLRQHPRVQVAVTVTTRDQRPGEVPDRDYHFVSREQFLQMKSEGRFAETNDVFANGKFYGSLRSELDAALQQAGQIYLMEVDVTGAKHLREAGYEGVYVFIEPPSAAVLERRLRDRATDSEEAIQGRLNRAAHESQAARALGAVIVVNQDVEATVRRILELIELPHQAQARP